ncbi:MAG: hypothetical protein K8U03_05700 [Planctomycetia bacterium]|nr:hypothetical protein [Planctomycetia bacterium]
MANVLKRERQLAVLNLLVEGSSIRAAERITGIHRDTICRLAVRFGAKCREFLDDRMRNLSLRHIEVDEQWTFVGKKQSRLTTDERAERGNIGDMYLWIGVDQDTKLVPTFALGKRSADMARRFMVDLASRLVPHDNPHASDAHAFKPEGFRAVTQLSTDGFAAYPEAVDLAFGPYVKFGTIVKEYRNANMHYTPSEMVGTERRGVFGIDGGSEASICTSHIERFNATTRLFLKRFNRLTLCFSKKLDGLAAAVAMYVAYYNFCWRTRKPGTTGKRRPTAAMAAGLSDHTWRFAELFEAVNGN